MKGETNVPKKIRLYFMGALGGILVVLLLCSGERANEHSFDLNRNQHVFPITEVVKNNLLESV